MSENKKYFYLKFKENFFDQDHIKVIEALENGYIFSNILLKMYLRSLKHEGKLMITEKIPYDKDKPEILAKVLGHDVSHLRECIKVAVELDIIKILNTGEIFMMDIQNYIGRSTTEADRIRSYRMKIKQLENNAVTNVQHLNDKNTPEIELDRELKIKKDIKPKKKKNKYKDCVYLTDKEYNKLLDKYGESQVEILLNKIDLYKGSKGKTYKSDYRAILLWVVDACKVYEISKANELIHCPNCCGNTERIDRDTYICSTCEVTFWKDKNGFLNESKNNVFDKTTGNIDYRSKV